MAKKKASPSTSPESPTERISETRVFKSGNSYAVRLPKGFMTAEIGPVHIRKLDDGNLLITPKEKRRWPTGFFESFGGLNGFETPERPRHDSSSDARDENLFRDE